MSANAEGEINGDNEDEGRHEKHYLWAGEPPKSSLANPRRRSLSSAEAFPLLYSVQVRLVVLQVCLLGFCFVWFILFLFGWFCFV